MDREKRAALNQIRDGLRADSIRAAEDWSAHLMSLTPEERAAFVEKEVAHTERAVPKPIRAAMARPAPAVSELAAKLDELYAAIEHLPFSDRMEILRGLGDAIGGGTGNESTS